MGRNTAARVTEMEMTAKNISLAPFIAACMGDSPSSTFLKIFSVTTMPSSTTRPVARTMASNVRILTEKTSRYMMKNVPISETGMYISGRNATLQTRKKKKMSKIGTAHV